MIQTFVETKEISVYEAGRVAGYRFRKWDNRWEKTPVDSFPDIAEVKLRLEVVKSVARVKQLYIAKEPVTQPIEIKLPKLPEINLPWKTMGKTALTVGSAVALGAGVVALVGAVIPIVLAVGAVMAVAMLDPAYLCELETGEIIEIYSDTR